MLNIAVIPRYEGSAGICCEVYFTSRGLSLSHIGFMISGYDKIPFFAVVGVRADGFVLLQPPTTQDAVFGI